MAGKKHIDAYVKDRLSERQYAFNEAYWDQAQAMLDLQEKRRKRKLFLLWWLGMGGLPVLLIGMGSFLFLQGKTADLDPQENMNVMMVADSGNQIDLVDEGQAPHPTDLTTNQALVSKDAKETGDAKVRSPHSISSLPKSDLMAQTAKANKGKRKAKADKKVNKNGSETNKKPFQRVLSMGILRSPRKRGELKQPDPNPILIKSGKQKEWKLNMLQERAFEWDVAIMQVTDSLGVLLSNYVQRKHHLGIDVGMSLSPDWSNTQSATKAFSLGPLIGLRYEYELKAGLRLVSGLRYSSRAGLNSDMTYISTDFSFGFQREKIVQSPRRMHFLEVPLLLDWHMGGRHYAQFGGQLNALIDVSGKEQKFMETESGEVLLSEENLWGLRRGFQRLHPSLNLAYGYYLGEGLRIGLQAQWSPTNLTNSEFFGAESLNRNLNARLILSKDLR
ncbi:MAG: hypothetical protein AAFY71_19270 [Bacteroidota bacterium]